MKNFEKLQQVYDQLDWLTDENQKEGRAFLVNNFRKLIQEFMVDNAPAPKKNTFDIWEWTCNDDLRPVLGGVFHDKESKCAVATDAHVLVADKDLYDESKADNAEGDNTSKEFWKGYRPIDKYGELIQGRFPNWKAVIPEKSDEYKTYYVTVKEVDEYINKCKAYKKCNGLTSKYCDKPMFNIPGTDSWFSATMLRTFLIASGGEINIKSHSHGGVYWGERRTALIMPMLYDPNCDRGDGIFLTCR